MIPFKFAHGTEEELQLVYLDEKMFGKLARKADEILDRIPKSERRLGDKGIIDRDFYGSQLEIVTDICHDIDELRESIGRERSIIIEKAEDLGYGVIACGINPVTESKKGETFGEHHHTFAKTVKEKVKIHNFLRELIPEFWSISASSPVYKGRFTGYMSYRGKKSRHIGCAPRLSYKRYKDEKSMENDNSLRYMDVTPFTKYKKPTVEVRLFDSQISLERTLTNAVLVEAISLRARRYCTTNEIPPMISRDVLERNREEAIKKGIHAVFVSERYLKYSPNFLYHGKFGYISATDAIGYLINEFADELDELSVSKKDMGVLFDLIKHERNISDWQIEILRRDGVKKLVEELIYWTKKGISKDPLL